MRVFAAQGIVAWMVVPFPTAEVIDALPSTQSIRSEMFSSPFPLRRAVSNPRPSSVTASAMFPVPSARNLPRMSMVMRVAPECLQAFCTASRQLK